MDNIKVMEKISFMAINQYVNSLVKSKICKATLFPVFNHTGAPDLSNPVYFILLNHLDVLFDANSRYIGN